MIYSINGQVKNKEKDSVILQTSQQITLYTYLNSREDAIELYSLSTSESEELKVALKILKQIIS
ncbi:MAG: hypothetical protein KAS12_00950 [Candidatus Aenigmarchaeota archaeon]|nr:hypothetical protein [Candidatus Aenigmarchaeota archaeon]